MTELTTHLRPETIAQLIAELIADHAAEYDTGEFIFKTERAKELYADLLAGGIANCGQDQFFDLLEVAILRVEIEQIEA